MHAKRWSASGSRVLAAALAALPAAISFHPSHPTPLLPCLPACRTAWCVGAMKQSYCGRCVRVTNLATGDSVEMTVVDACGTGGVDMDPIGFNAIDGDGAGVRDGHMMVDVEWC